MKFTKVFTIAMSAIAMILTACSEDDSNPFNGEGEGEIEQKTPAESKEYIDGVATEFIQKFNAAEQQEVMDMCNYFAETFGDLELPSNFEIGPDGENAPLTFMKSLSRGLSGANAVAAGGAVKIYTYSINFWRFKGVYEPGKYEWERTGDSDDIIFRFKNSVGSVCELKAVASKNTNGEIELSVSDYDYKWTPENGYVDEEFTNLYKITIPREVTVTLTQAGKELVMGKVVSDIDINGHNFTASVDAKIQNISVNVVTSGNDSQVKENSTLMVSGETLVSFEAVVNGKRLCDKANWERVSEDEDGDYYVEDFLTNGTAKVDILDKIQVYGNISEFSTELMDALDGYWDSYDYSEAEAKAEAGKAAAFLNKKLPVVVKYQGTATEQANIQWKVINNKWGVSGWEYYLLPVLYFPVDDTTYEIEAYFEKGFAGVVNAWEDLIDSYVKLWDGK